MSGLSGMPKAGTSTAARVVKNTLTVVFLALATASVPFLTPAMAQSYSFSNVEIVGNQRVDAATILTYAGIGRGESISAGALNDATQRLVNSGLFESVVLDPNGGTLVIRVTEFPMLNAVDFQGNKRLKDEDLTAAIESRSRLVYSPAQAEADAAALADLYTAKGRIAASVQPRIIRRSDNRVDLVFEIAEGKVVEIERLSFIGNRAFTDRRLRQILETKQATLLRNLIQRDTFDAPRLDLDKQLLRDFYASRGYMDFQILDATADVSRERDAFFLSFTVQEGQSFAVGNVSTVSEIEGVNAAEFDAVRRLRPGVTYSPLVIENNIARMETLALKKGLNFVQVVPQVTRNDRNQTVDVQFVLTRGERVFVERIDIEGNTTTLDSVVRRQFRTVEGDPFNPREIRQSAERIRALGFFANSDVQSRPGSAADQVVIKVTLEEQPTGSVSFGATYGTSNGVGLNLGYSETNFLGRGQGLNLSVQSGTDTIDSNFAFVEPTFLGRDLRFRFAAGYSASTQSDEFYNTRILSATPALEFPVSERGRVELRYKIAEETISDVDTDSSVVVQNEAGTEVSSAIGYSYSYDTRRSRLDDKSFLLLRFGQDYAGLGGDVQSVTSTAFALAESRVLNEEIAVRMIFEGGMVNGIGGYGTRVTDRFFGNGKIRGFEPNGLGPRDLTAPNQDALGGNVFAAARFEAEFPLGLPEEYGINGGAFVDLGSVWSLDNTNGTGGVVDDSFHLRSVAGLAILWKTPIGPLRFNFTRALIKEDYDNEQTFDLTISTKF